MPHDHPHGHEKHHHVGPSYFDGLPALMEVAGVRNVSESMVRISFAGKGVKDYLSQPRIPNIKLYFPDEHGNFDMPQPKGSHHYDFTPEQRARVRTYTVRRYDAESGILDIDFVMHGDEGLASAWAARAKVGDKLATLGGGGRLPAPCSWLLLIADDTGLPGALAILEQLPPDQRGLALLEVSVPGDRQRVNHPEGMEVRWLLRGATHPGTSHLLLDEACAVEIPQPYEDAFVWASAEARVVRAVRKHVRFLGVPRRNQLIIGYWHLGRTETAYSVADNHDRVRDESSVTLPESVELRDDSLSKLLAGFSR